MLLFDSLYPISCPEFPVSHPHLIGLQTDLKKLFQSISSQLKPHIIGMLLSVILQMDLNEELLSLLHPRIIGLQTRHNISESSQTVVLVD